MKKRTIMLFAALLMLLMVPVSAAVTQTTQIVGNDTVVKFSGSGSSTWTPPSGVTSVKYLVVGGGGSGAGYLGGGGGGGGVKTGNTSIGTDAITVVVGAGGGTSGTNGGDSSFGSFISHGGGHGSSGGGAVADTVYLATSGGSGGGGGSNHNANYRTGAAGISGEGNSGGASPGPGGNYASGGGGGAGGSGTAGSTVGGAGGVGIASDITGVSTYYGGGGSGAYAPSSGNQVIAGGLGGGGAGGSYNSAGVVLLNGTDGTDALGGGGGGGGFSHPDWTTTHKGGSGIVIIRYLTPVAPVAAFSGTPTSGTAPFAVTFTDASTNNPTSWSWNFGDGNTSTAKNPAFTYAKAGNYTVSLTATNSAGSNTISKTNYIWVKAPVIKPVAAFSGTPTTGTVPFQVTFTDASTNSPTSWSWNFGDGNTSTAKNPAFTYTKAGNYTVSLTATNSAGSNTTTKTNYIWVKAPVIKPVAAFSGTPTTGTVPFQVTFTDASTNSPTSWSWNFGDGNTSTAKNPAFTYTKAGNYTVSLTATNSAGSNTTTKTNYIWAKSVIIIPVAAINATPRNGTVPLTVSFSDVSLNTPTSWLWHFGDGNISTSQNPVHTYVKPGSYIVNLTSTNSAGSNRTESINYITVWPAPVNASTLSATSDLFLNQPGEDITMNLMLDSVPNGLSGYNLNVSISNASVAQITSVTFPEWASQMNNHDPLPGSHDFLIRASDVNDSVKVGSTGVTLASLTIRGLSPGDTNVILTQANIDDETGSNIPLIISNGNLTVDLPLDDPEISGITPASGFTNGSVVFVLNGTGFRTDSMIRLTGLGSEISASDIFRTSQHIITGTFNLTGQKEGRWNVTLTNPDTKSATLNNGFKITRPHIPIPGMANVSLDLNGDGLYEDVNSNGQLDYADVNVYYQSVEWIIANEPFEAFDFNQNGRIDTGDVNVLFNMIM